MAIISTDTSIAYQKTVVEGAHIAELKAISGKSVVRNQYSHFTSDVSRTFSGVDFGVDADTNTMTANGTATGNIIVAKGSFGLTIPSYISGHKYLLRGCPSGGGNNTYGWRYNNNGFAETGNGVVLTCAPVGSTASSNIIIEGSEFPVLFMATGQTFSNSEWKINVIDLTQMFGSDVAATITTPEEAYALGCPREYIPYDAGTVVSAKADKIISNDENNELLEEFAIPSAIRELEGYGESYGEQINIVNFSDKTYTEYGHYEDDEWIAESTPITISISALLKDISLFINCEEYGNLTFHQENDIKLPIQSTVTYYTTLPIIDNFISDITINDKNLFQNYITNFFNGNYQTAYDILPQEQLSNKILYADFMNSIANILLGEEGKVIGNTTGYLQELLSKLNNKINQFYNTQEFDTFKTYRLFNFTHYNGKYYLYINENPAVGSVALPSDPTYWALVDLSGEKGAMGTGLHIQYNWSPVQNYRAKDLVIYGQKMWVALLDNTNQPPQAGSQYWQEFIDAENAQIYSSIQQPSSCFKGQVWFKMYQ